MATTSIFSILLGLSISIDPGGKLYEVGEAVVVIRSADLTVRERAVQQVSPGLPLIIEGRQQNRYWVSHRNAGWIDADAVASPEAAVEHFSAMIGRQPDDPAGYVARGAAYSMLRQYTAAIKDYDQLVRLAPDVANSYACRGACWSLQRKHDKAIEDYTTAIRIDPQEPIFFNNRASAWLQKTDLERAIADADTALRLSPQLETAFVTRAMAHAGRNDYVAAQADCEAAHGLNARSGTGFNAVAWYLATNRQADRRNGPRAVEFARKACAITNWKSASQLDTLATALAEAGDFVEAVKWEQRAMELAPIGDRVDYAERLSLFQRSRAFHEPPPE